VLQLPCPPCGFGPLLYVWEWLVILVAHGVHTL
jgi:hypothetical protein